MYQGSILRFLYEFEDRKISFDDAIFLFKIITENSRLKIIIFVGFDCLKYWVHGSEQKQALMYVVIQAFFSIRWTQMADASDSFRMSVTFFRTKWHFGMLVSDAYVKLGCWWQKWSILSTKIGFANRACFLLDQPKSFLSLKAFGRFRLFQGHFVLGACSFDGRLRLWTWTCSFSNASFHSVAIV